MNSYMRSPRSVTFAPITIPSRSLKFETLLRALQSCGCCPVIAASSPTSFF